MSVAAVAQVARCTCMPVFCATLCMSGDKRTNKKIALRDCKLRIR